MNRIQYLDLAKFFAIWSVIAGHFFLLFEDPSYIIHNAIYAFHMPLFMMLSGFFAKNALSLSFAKLIKNKAFHLLFPTIACTLGEILIKWLSGSEMTISFIKDICIGNSWFLKTLFIIFVIVRITKYTIKSHVIGMIVSCVFICIIPHSYSLQLNWMLPWFWIGLILNKHSMILKRMNSASTIICIVLFTLSYSLCYKGTEIISINNLVAAPYTYIWQFVTALWGCLSVIGLSKIICEKFTDSTIVNHMCTIGKYTLEIYLIQTLVVVAALGNLFNLTTHPILQECMLPIASLLILYACLLIVNAIYKNKLTVLLFFAK